MGRHRKRDKHLPRGVYLEHGAYYFRGRDRKRVPLGRELPEALGRYATLIAGAWSGRTVGDLVDRYRVEVLPLKRSQATRSDQDRELTRLKKAFGHMPPESVTAQHCFEGRGYIARSALIRLHN